ncbi:MAG: CBS domain-containing protein [Nitrososphaera sp.]|uniref:CBS domain-containing protein n=1 Tax=Nitrososphaera sp. TaxID=1971748 RepID=UPI00184792F7|nr:CBS domain-containing protein [Nitrososphaera sp.]NWG37727.1 CBS domain-containing protein [Nitrososphaera sp.]
MSKAKLSDIMNKRLVIIKCNSSIKDIAEIMAAKRVSAVVLVDSGRPVGILTERDLARQVCANDLTASKTPATALMSAPVVAVGADLTMQDAAEVMVKNGVRHLAVENKKHRLVGMVTATDFARYTGRKAFGESTVLDLLYPYEEMGEEMP